MGLEQQQISPSAAREKAAELRGVANELEDLLNKVSMAMQQVNDEDTKMYQGSKRPSQLRQELDEFRGTFNLVHAQIQKFSDNIVITADAMENQ